MKMNAPKKERSLALRIAEGADLEEDEMDMITRDFKKYIIRGKCSSRKWKKEWAERRNRKKEQVHPKKNKGATKAMVAAWGESSDEESEDEDRDEQALMAIGESDDEQALMAIGESDDEQEVSVFHLKDKINFLSKERLFEFLIDFIDESEVINNEKEQLSKECVILKAQCNNLELRASESDSKNTELKNHVLELETIVLKLRSENLKLKLGTSKKKTDQIHVTLEENLVKMKDEQIRVLKEDLGKVKMKGSSQIYYMDSGCSKHMTRSKNQFLSLEDLKRGNVSFGIGKKKEIIGVGKIVSKDLVIELPNIKFKEDKVCEAFARRKQEHQNKAIGLVKELNEAAPEEGTGDETGSSV
ncbi:uncharacterized protein [Nicotiana sylvestris]|uniref:uncharacterized protein n=1 Tax=Nicotiana sylvestris TaxID=4096 RepID=UPI00388CEAAD